MDTANIKIGQLIKNYKVLCEILGEKTKTGESKKAHLREMERHFSYVKEGIGFRIVMIYAMPLEKPQNIPYLKYMEDLILDMLYFRESHDQSLLFSKNKFFLELKMINSNYNLAKSNKYKFSEISGEEIIDIEDFYNVSDKMLQRHLESALNNLQDKSIILWRNAFTVCEIEYEGLEGMDFLQRTYVNDMAKQGKIEVQKSYRKATVEEIKKILETEYAVLKKRGFESKKDVYKRRITSEFISDVTSEAFDGTMILFYYSSYEIIPNEQAVSDVGRNILNLSDTKIKEAEVGVNSGVSKRLVENSSIRHKKSTGKSILERSFIDEVRASEEYVSIMSKLCSILIESESKSIESDMFKK